MSYLPPLPRSMTDNHFLSDKIKESIEKNHNKFTKTEFILDDRNTIQVVGISLLDELEQAIEIYEEVRDLARSSSISPQKPIRCYIYLVDVPKQLDLKKDNITYEECNSGSSTFYNDYIEVVLWRREEWQKVFYHELIHSFHIDKHIVQENPRKDQQLSLVFPHFNNSILEAYTEILATILYLEKKGATSTNSKMKDQNLFLGTQINKIIHFMENSTASSRETIKNFLVHPSKLLDGSTNTCSYYILKSIYLWNGIYYDKNLLKKETLLNKEFINSHFYDLFIDTLQSNAYTKWLTKIYFTPKNNSLKLTL